MRNIKRNKDQIIKFGGMSIVFLVGALILEFCNGSWVIEIFPFLSGHRDFGINFFMGCACSGIVVVIGEYFDYCRTMRQVTYEVNSRLKSLYSSLKQIANEENLTEIQKLRDRELSEYAKPFELGRLYHPFKITKEKSKILGKLIILDFDIYELFYLELNILIANENRQLGEYYDLLAKMKTEEDKSALIAQIKVRKREIEKIQRYNLNIVKMKARGIIQKIESYKDVLQD